MKKSKEQIISEFGECSTVFADIPECWDGYFFKFKWSSNERTYYWDFAANIKCLERTITSKIFEDAVFTGYRRLQTDWRSINDFVIYDRFGSKLTWTEEPKRSIEVKLTDAGARHWSLCNSIIVDNVAQRRIQLQEMHSLFTKKEYI